MPTASQVTAFFKHLRLNYNLLIMSAPYLAGGLFSPRTGVTNYLWVFFAVHVCLFGGATAFNSYWDKDEGPIGGLRHPPKMKKWMHGASLLLQFLGLIITAAISLQAGILYLLSAILFWAYSSPLTRWKTKPLLAMISMGVLGGISALIGYYAFGGVNLNSTVILVGLACTCFIMGLYAFSQSYQYEDDKKKGDNTIVVAYGLRGIKTTFIVFYSIGAVLVSIILLKINTYLGIGITLAEIIGGIIIWRIIGKLRMKNSDYNTVMNTKYILSGIFVTTLLVLFGTI